MLSIWNDKIIPDRKAAGLGGPDFNRNLSYCSSAYLMSFPIHR